MFFLVFLLPFGGALAARLRPSRWQVWAGCGLAGLAAFLAAWLGGWLSPGQAAIVAVGSSAFGFLGPELWEGLRGAVRNGLNSLFRPRNLWLAALAAAGWFLLQQPALLERVLVLAVVIGGLWLMVTGPFRGRRRR